MLLILFKKTLMWEQFTSRKNTYNFCRHMASFPTVLKFFVFWHRITLSMIHNTAKLGTIFLTCRVSITDLKMYTGFFVVLRLNLNFIFFMDNSAFNLIKTSLHTSNLHFSRGFGVGHSNNACDNVNLTVSYTWVRQIDLSSMWGCQILRHVMENSV